MNLTKTLAVSIVLAATANVVVAAESQPVRSKFVAPFAVREGVIRDANGREVRLWGVNYYAPFSHNYQNIAEVGADHRAAIAQDVAQFRLMGVDFVRIHVFDREISDVHGHLTPNDHLRVFDELLEALDRAGIFVMLTPVAWWNTPENQSLMDRYYAFWHVGVGGSFGFSNFFGADEMVWNEDAIRCQERYVAELLEHRSSISNRRYADFPNLVAIEPINEPSYVRPSLLREVPNSAKPTTQYAARSSHGAARKRLHKLWHDFQTEHPGDETTQFEQFRAELLQRYLERMFAAIDSAMKHPYLRAHIDYSLGDARIHEVLNNMKLDAYTCACYPKDHMGFESTWRDHLDFFELIRQWNAKLLAQKVDDRPRIVYEFNAPSTLQGYPYGAMAVAFAARRAQMAAMFTYTPTAVAQYNPGWRIHYLNLLHTPARAAAFAAAGQIFRRVAVNTPLPTDAARWSGPGWSIRNKPDAVAFAGDGLLVHSANLPKADTPTWEPTTILASGSSRFVTAEGAGIYHLERTSPGHWRLTVFPNERLVNDPFRGRSFRPMANRYINVNEWPVVSRLQQGPRRFVFHLGGTAPLSCTPSDAQDARRILPASDGSFSLQSGTYHLRKKGDAAHLR